jgi:HAD superfamily hydrolase (TIGR01509 family)
MNPENSAKSRADDARPASVEHDVVEAVLLDIDGTLLDSNDAHAQAWSDALREAGHEIGSEAVRPLVGMGSDKLLPQLTGLDAEHGEGKQLVERRKEVFAKEYLPTVRPFPAARDLLDRMRADGLRLVVATSASGEELAGLLHALGAEWLLDEAASKSDADRSKPDPDIVRAALDKAGVGPARCVMLGDTPYDVEAATRAGVRVIALRCGGWGDDELRGAAAVYDDPKELLAYYESSLIGGGVRARAGERTGESTAREPDVQRGEGSDTRDQRASRSAEEESHGHGA